MTMKRTALAWILTLTATAVGHAQVNDGWKGGTAGEPQGAPVRTGLPPGTTSPTVTLTNGTAPTPGDPNGTVALYLLNDGVGLDTTGPSVTHLEAEGASYGSFRTQMWTRWTGLLTKARADADAAFGADAWTIRKIWVVVDPATGIPVGCNPGFVSLAEVSGLSVKGGVADFGDRSTALTETGGNAATQIPAGYHGHNMGPTQPTGVCINQATVDPDVFLILDETDATQLYPTGSVAFQKLVSGMNTRVRPVQDGFTLYWAPINDTVEGNTVGVSYDGWPAGSFGFDPYLLFELVKQDPLTGANPPQIQSLQAVAPFTPTLRATCTGSVFASDTDVGDTLTFTITNPGSLGGSISPAGPAAGTDLGGGNWQFDFTYTIPVNVRGKDVFQVQVSDGTNVSFGQITYVIRGDAIQNMVAFGASSGDAFDTMRMYTGASVPGGGTAGTLDRLVGPGFAQSAEFDNYNGLRHNPEGNLLALDFGPGPNGPGTLILYATQGTCDDPGGTTIFTFDAASTGLGGDSRVTGLSVSPDNTKLAIVGVNTFSLFILDYATGVDVGQGGTGAATVALDQVIDLSGIMAAARSVGTTWLDDETVLVVDTDGSLQTADVPSGMVTTDPFNPYIATPRPTPNISTADIEYNPEISPYIFVVIGEFSAGASTNTVYVADPSTQTVVDQSGGQDYTDYSDGTMETFREAGLDCFGNLFIGTFVDFGVLTNIKYLPNATTVAGIVGGNSSLVIWRTIDTGAGEGASNFSGLDVATATTIGTPGGCSNTPPIAEDVVLVTEIDTPCVLTLTANDSNLGDTITFDVDSPGPNGGTLVPFGAVMQTGTTRTQTATYTPASGFRGVECFAYRANDGAQDGNDADACANVRDSAADGTIAFGGSLPNANQTMRLYYGVHVAEGGTCGDEDVLAGLAFAQSTEFDNYGGTWHNPNGNLLALNFGTVAAGGSVYVYATEAECGGSPATQIFAFDDATVGPADRSRVVGLSVSPDNTKVACYGVDTKKIYVLDYTIPGGAPAVGKGGASAAALTFNTSIDMSGINTSTRSMSTTWLNNTTILWTDEAGNLYTVTTGGSINLERPNPRPASAISMTDIEYNPSISSNIYVSISEFTSPTTTNTLYVVNSAGFAIVTQSGGVNYTDHSTVGLGTGTHREIGLSTGGKLFISTFVDAADRVNIRYINNATTPSSITDNSSVLWNEQDAGQSISNFCGMDVAAGVPVAVCALPGDLNVPTPDGVLNGLDIQRFTDCYLSSFGGAPGCGCACADVAAPFGTIDYADVGGFVNLLVP